MKPNRKDPQLCLILGASIMIIGLACHGAACAQVFKWTDKKGAVHYGDVVPDAYKKTARPVAMKNDTPTDAQIQEAEKQLDKLRASSGASVSPSASAPQASVPPASLSASSPIDARRLSCDEQWKRFEASHACFDPYRMGNGMIRPEAFQHCEEIKPPQGCKDTRTFKW